MKISDIARQRGISRSLLYTWRREAAAAMNSVSAVPDLVLVMIAGTGTGSKMAPSGEPGLGSAKSGGSIEVASPGVGGHPPRPRKLNRGALPEHLPRVEMVVDIEDRHCPCCGGALHPIGEDVAQRLDVIPQQFRVLVIRRPKYACRTCPGTVVQAPAPPHLIEGGLPTEALVAHVITAKYADHTPLYRQAQIYGRQGIEPRSFDPGGLGGSRRVVAATAARQAAR